MPKSTAFDPVVTRSSNDQYGVAIPANTYSVAVDPICRQFSGDQTVVAEIAS